MSDRLCYLDNAATSFPKPETVPRAVFEILRGLGANPGRGGHQLSLRAERILFGAREEIALFFNCPNSRNIVFTKNATESINLALKGLLHPGDHVVVSGMEHNAVMRPLEKLAQRGIRYTVAPVDSRGFLGPEAVVKAVRPDTALIAMTHASNITGTILPIREVGRIAEKRNIPFLVDATQTAGVLKIDMQADCIDLLACTGHKGLLGPQGTGFLAIREGTPLETLMEGGTGSLSDSLQQPELLPDRFESGTQNTPGIGGLRAGLAFIRETGLTRIRERERSLTGKLLDSLSQVGGIDLVGPCDPDKQTAVISFRVSGRDPGEIGDCLDTKFGIITRVGLHCAPLAHRSLGTYPEGTVRVSPGFFTRDAEIDYFLHSLKEVVRIRDTGP